LSARGGFLDTFTVAILVIVIAHFGRLGFGRGAGKVAALPLLKEQALVVASAGLAIALWMILTNLGTVAVTSVLSACVLYPVVAALYALAGYRVAFLVGRMKMGK